MCWACIGKACSAFEAALTQSRHEPSVARFWVLDAAVLLTIFQGDYARAAEFTREELALARELGDPELVGAALTEAGTLAYRQGVYEQAQAHLDEALRLLRHVAETPRGIHSSGGGHHSSSSAMWPWLRGTWSRRHATMRPHWTIFETVNSSGCPSMRRPVSLACGTAAVTWWERPPSMGSSLEQAHSLGSGLLMASALLGLAGIAAESGQPETGAHLLGAVEGIAASLGAPIFPRDTPVRDRTLAALTAALGEEPARGGAGGRPGADAWRQRLPRPRPSLRPSWHRPERVSMASERGGRHAMPPVRCAQEVTMSDLPSGTVTFLFTDIEGSTALWERDRTAMAAAVERHLGAAAQRRRGTRRRAVQGGR